MHQATHQDIQALASSATRPETVLAILGQRLRDIEPFDAAEIVTRGPYGLRRFVVAAGLEDVAEPGLASLGAERFLRFDTPAHWAARSLAFVAGRQSLLAVRLDVPETTGAALLLSHSRAWSFAGAPVVRLRAIAEIALRLILALESRTTPTTAPGDDERLKAEVVRLRAHVASLEGEIVELRASGAPKRRSGKQR